MEELHISPSLPAPFQVIQVHQQVTISSWAASVTSFCYIYYGRSSSRPYFLLADILYNADLKIPSAIRIGPQRLKSACLTRSGPCQLVTFHPIALFLHSPYCVATLPFFFFLILRCIRIFLTSEPLQIMLICWECLFHSLLIQLQHPPCLTLNPSSKNLAFLLLNT